ncbi:hypothetical protein BKA81DRAFT_193962 [Phyllosticta paracitricarpa]
MDGQRHHLFCLASFARWFSAGRCGWVDALLIVRAAWVSSRLDRWTRQTMKEGDAGPDGPNNRFMSVCSTCHRASLSSLPGAFVCLSVSLRQQRLLLSCSPYFRRCYSYQVRELSGIFLARYRRSCFLKNCVCRLLERGSGGSPRMCRAFYVVRVGSIHSCSGGLWLACNAAAKRDNKRLKGK